MPFNVEAYRKEMKAKGVPDSLIEQDIAEEQANDKKSQTPFMAAQTAKVDETFNKNVDSTKTEILGAKIPTNLLGIGAAGAAGLGAGAYLANRKGSSPPAPQLEPTFDTPQTTPPAGPTPEEVAAQTRIAKQQSAIGQMNSPQAAPMPAEVPQSTPVQALQDKLASMQAAQPPIPSVTAPPVNVAPPVLDPIVTASPHANPISPVAGQPVNNPLHVSIDVDGNPKVPEVFKVDATEPTIPKARETSAFIADANKNAPEGMRYNSAKNKVGDEVIGRGGFNHAYALYGPETDARWQEQYGPKNVPYEQVRDDISAARRPFPEGSTGMESAHVRPKFVPKYIKGAVSPGMLATVAGVAALPSLASAGYQAATGNGEEANKSLGNAMESVKGLVTGPYEAGKQALQGNFAPAGQMALETALMAHPLTGVPTIAHSLWQRAMQGAVPAPPNAYQDRMKYEKKVGAGRGVAPPSSYQQ